MSNTAKKILGIAMVVVGVAFSWMGWGIWVAKAGLLLIASAAKEKKAKSAASSTFGTELQLSGDPNEVRKIIYGRAWTGGTLRYRNTAGTDNRDLYMVLVLDGHESDGVESVQADRETLVLDGSGNVTLPLKWAGKMNVRFLLGTDAQAADATLDAAFPNWTTDHRLRACTLAILKLSFDEENLNSVPAFRFLVRGRKVYDPRLDSTNGGSGSHRLATPSTWAWSENNVLCENDYLRGVMVNNIRIAGLGIATTRFPWPLVIGEANVCDENVALAAGGNEKRYTANGVIDPQQAHTQVIEQFEQARAGDTLFGDGKWRQFAGAYRAPSLQLTAQHFVGPLRLVVHRSLADRRDTAHGRFSSLADSGAVVPFSPVSLASAVVGSELVTTIDMPLVNDATNSPGNYDGGARAQRIAKLLLERDAAGKTLKCSTSLYGLRAVPGESIGLTHAAFGLSAQTMRVMDVQLRPTQEADRVGLVVELTLGAGPASLYSWSAEETAIGATPALPQATVPAASGVSGWTPLYAGISKSGNSYVKTGGTNGVWDASVYSQEGFEACSGAWRFSQTNGSIMVGLNTDPTTDNDYTSIDYALWGAADGNVYIIESGVTAASPGAYTTNDQFEIKYDGSLVRYLKNGTVLRTVSIPGARLYLDTSFYTSNSAIDSLLFGSQSFVAQEMRAQMHDEFAYNSWADLGRRWTQRQGGAGAGDFALLTGLTDAPGGQANRFGNNSGNDEWWGAFAEHLIPYDGVSLYEVGVIVRRTAGAGNLYVGLEGVAQDQVTLITTAGANSYNPAHYLAAYSASPGSSWTTYKGYAKGLGGSPVIGPSNDPRAPSVMYTGTVYVRPMILVNFTGAAGTTDIAALWVKRIPGGQAALDTDVYRQSSAPTHAPGRLWQDTDDGRIYRSDGSSWIQITAADALLLTNAPAQAGADVTALNADDIVFRQSAAPSSPQAGWVWLDTDDLRLYRYNGTIWQQIGADDALLLTNGPAEPSAQRNRLGTALNANPMFSDQGGNASLNGWTWPSATAVTLSDGQVGRTAGQIVIDGSVELHSDLIPVDLGEQYRLSVWLRQPSGGRNAYLQVACYDAAGNFLDATTYPGTGWSGGTYHYWSLAGGVIPSSWTYYTTTFGPSTERTLPSQTRYVKIGGLLPYIGGTANATTIQVQAYELLKLTTQVYRQSSAPAHLAGRIWVDTDDGRIYRSDGGSWTQITAADALLLVNGPAEAGADVTALNANDIVFRQSSAPSSPQEGWIWIDTDDRRAYRRSSGAWVQFSSDDALLLGVNAPAEAGADATANNANDIVYRQSSAPGSPQAGWIWIDTDDLRAYRYSGSVWVQFSADDARLLSAGAPAETGADVTANNANDIVFRQSSAPSSPQEGWTWIDTDDARVYRYTSGVWQFYTAGDALQLTNAPAQAGADVTASNANDIVFRQSSAPSSPQAGWIWIDTDDLRIYRYDGSSWIQIGANDATVLTNGPAQAGADRTAANVFLKGANTTDPPIGRNDTNSGWSADGGGPDADVWSSALYTITALYTGSMRVAVSIKKSLGLDSQWRVKKNGSSVVHGPDNVDSTAFTTEVSAEITVAAADALTVEVRVSATNPFAAGNVDTDWVEARARLDQVTITT